MTIRRASAAHGPRAAPTAERSSSSSRGDKGLCGSFNTNVIKGAATFVTASPEPCSLGARRPQGPRLLRPPRVRRAVRADRLFQKLSLRAREGDRPVRDRSVHRRAVRSRDARLQRVQVGDVAAGRRRSAAADSRAGRRGGRPAAARPAGAAGRLPLRAVAAGDLQSAAAALRRGPGLSRAPRDRTPRSSPRR